MQVAIELIRTLFWCATFLAVIAGILFIVYIAGFVSGEDAERERQKKIKEGAEEAADRFMRKLIKKDSDWEKEIDV